MSAVDLVRELDKASERYNLLDRLRREIRLGRNVGQGRRTGRFMMLKGVYGFGWSEAKFDEPIRISNDLQSEFYAFLTEQLDEAGAARREVQARLDGLK